MAKKAGFPATVDDRTKGGVLSKHVAELTGHTLDSASYNGHGYAVGKQGAKDHPMVPNDAHKQGGAHIPAAVLPANRQNTYSDEGSADAAADCTGDYGTADK